MSRRASCWRYLLAQLGLWKPRPGEEYVDELVPRAPWPEDFKEFHVFVTDVKAGYVRYRLGSKDGPICTVRVETFADMYTRKVATHDDVLP